MELGLVQIYTGEGKGKTTAALGQGLRAAGRGLKVKIIQFLKSEESGELYSILKLSPEISLERFNSQKKFVWTMNEAEIEILKKESRKGFEYAREIVEKNVCDVLILDEFIWILNKGVVNFSELKEVILNKPKSMEIIMTGRGAKIELFEIADYVTEMKKIKHPYEKGIEAREGIEK